MKLDVRQEIINTADMLFNRHGYNSVTMRNIADQLDMSVGNLTYHFKKKDDLIEAVVLSNRNDHTKIPLPQTLEELDFHFRTVFIRQQNRGFYFHHYKELAHISKRVYQMQISIMQRLRHMLTKSFKIFKEKGYAQEDSVPNQLENLIQVLISLSVHDIPQLEPQKATIYLRLDCVWTTIYPILTESGKTIYLEKIAYKHEKRDDDF